MVAVGQAGSAPVCVGQHLPVGGTASRSHFLGLFIVVWAFTEQQSWTWIKEMEHNHDMLSQNGVCEMFLTLNMTWSLVTGHLTNHDPKDMT